MKRRTRKTIEKYLYAYGNKNKENQEWNNLIEQKLKTLNEEELKLINLRYFDKKNINYITFELYMSRNKYFSMIDNILTEIAIDAAYYHLLKR